MTHLTIWSRAFNEHCVTVEVIVYNPHIVKLLMSHDDKTAIYLLHVNKIRCEDNLQAILQKHY